MSNEHKQHYVMVYILTNNYKYIVIVCYVSCGGADGQLGPHAPRLGSAAAGRARCGRPLTIMTIMIIVVIMIIIIIITIMILVIIVMIMMIDGNNHNNNTNNNDNSNVIMIMITILIM